MSYEKVAVMATLTLMVAMAAEVGASNAGPRRYFVAVDGNDAWSGKLPAPNAKRTDGPFATLERARDEVRSGT